MKKRCVPNNLEVVLNVQPQQKEEVKENEEVKIEKKNVEEEQVVNTKEENNLVQSPKEVIEVPKEKPKKKKVEKKIVVDETPKYDREVKRGNSLYTISAVVKIGQERFRIQRVIEEKDKRLANIEYDRVIKKEFGKSKSMTKRTLKEYENGDEEFCNPFKEVAPVAREKTPEELEFERKLEILDSDVFGLFKVTFQKNDLFENEVMYLYAEDADNTYYQLKSIAEDSEHPEKADYIVSKVKNVIRMTGSSIRVDKQALKKISQDSIEEMETMLKKATKIAEKRKEDSKALYKKLSELGFTMYAGKFGGKKRTSLFLEMARNEREAAALAMAEDRLHNSGAFIPDINKISMRNLDEVLKEVAKSSDEEEKTPEEKADINIKTISDLSKKSDTVYNLLCTKIHQSIDEVVEKYIKYCDTIVEVSEGISNGNAKEFLIKKLEEVSEELGKKIELHKIEVPKVPNFFQTKKN